MKTPLWIDGARLGSVLTYAEAVTALADALARPTATVGSPPRQSVDTEYGQMLLMPDEIPPFAGVKVVTVAPGNPAVGLPRINGVYVLFDSVTLRPVALFDAAALTAVRTAAVSALAVDRLAVPAAVNLVVFGAGPQARAHVVALGAVRPLRRVTVVTRTAEKASVVVEEARRVGMAASSAGAESVAKAVATADIIACCTTAREPLFDSAGLAAEATVVAVGSHEPDARELDTALVCRATLVVESRASASTAGDIVLAAAESHRSGPDLVAGELTDLVGGRVGGQPGRPRVFKSVGEAWEDLVVAAAVYLRV